MADPVAKFRPVISPEVLYRFPNFSPASTPTTNDIHRICERLNTQQLNECTDLFLELMAWGVTPEYLADSGFSLAGVIWLCAKCKIRLTEDIVERAKLARIPLHHLSIMPGNS
ncbi:hypothetical protein NP233_g11736 [Leucocoprinus birnbaumii]|uniref:Uncharacterized protein n=1 Tax=Leucocoprinus birnbaumii TaxID=56174 RepID=A0AAD5VFU4_9AGAR|nr:hypothetical protein NP233_g11736 [Leucocoprinus birnbaumii]